MWLPQSTPGLAAWLRGLPWWLRAGMGVVVVLLGLVLLGRPFDSLGVLIVLIAASLAVEGVVRIARRGTDPVLGVGIGALLVLAGVVVALWPGLTVRALAVVAGGTLVLRGGVRLYECVRGQREEVIASVMTGLSAALVGLVVLAWPDVTLLVVALGFGLRMIVLGVTGIVHALRRSDTAPPAGIDGADGTLPYVVRGVRSAVLLVLAVLLAGGTLLLHVDTPAPGSFYTAPEMVPAQPGQLIRSRPYSQAVPNSHVVPSGARGWLILYTTTGVDGSPAVASAFVMASRDLPAGPRPVIAWDHGTQGADARCAPTVLPAPSPMADPSLAMEKALGRGWVLVGTDYAGLGTGGPQGYLIGQAEARNTLDAVRAARQLTGLSLAPDTVVWGHSQGGHAALWTGIVAGDYAPDVRLRGVAAAAPASDLPAIVARMETTTVGKIMGSFLARAYAETYPDIAMRDYVDPRMELLVEQMSKRCVSAKTTFASLLAALSTEGSMYATSPTTGAFGRRLRQNVPDGDISVPVFIAQGLEDDLVEADLQTGYVESRCRSGQPVDYRTYPGLDHLTLVDRKSPYNADLLSWTADRLSGVPAAAEPTCSAMPSSAPSPRASPKP